LLILSLEDCLEAEINVPDRVKEGMFIIDRWDNKTEIFVNSGDD
jgi:hypothetical protein